MKRIIMFVLLFAALKVAGQTTGYLRFDTVKIMKQNGTCELYLINKTKDSLGLLTNVGGGLTRFIKSKAINDSSIVVGLDTLVIRGASGAPLTLNNVGTGYALVATPGGNVKKINNGYGILIDSTTTANTITIQGDTSSANHLVTQSDLNDAIAGATPTLQAVTDAGNTTTNDIIVGSRTSSVGRFSVEKTYTSLNVHSFDDYSTLSPSVGGDGFSSFDASTTMTGSVNNDHYIGYQSRLHYTASGNLTGDYGLTGIYVYNEAPGSGTISNAHGIYIRNIGQGGTITNAYGLRILPVTVGTNNFGIRSEGGKNSFVDEVMIGGHTTPIAKLDVRNSSYDQTIYCDNTKANGYAAIFNASNGSGSNVGLDITASGGTGNKGINFGSAMGTSDWNIYSSGGSKAYIAGKVGIGSSVTSPDSTLQINGSFHNNAGVRMTGLPTGPGTKAVRIDANGTLSAADTTVGGGSSHTFSNGLTEDGGTVKLGGVLTESTHISGGASAHSVQLDSMTSITLFAGLEYVSSGIGSNIQMSDSVMTIGATSATDFTSFTFSPTRIKFTAADGAGNAGDVWTNTGSGYGHWAAPSGSWSPTLTADANVDGTPTALHATYTRLGNIVTCYVTVSVDPTANTTQTEVGIPLPVASNFANANDVSGTGSGSIGNGQATFVQVSANTTSDRATLIFQSGSTSTSIVTLSFQYTIL